MIDILTYSVIIGCEFFALCAMTRGGRGWGARILGLAVLVAVDVVTEMVWQTRQFTPDLLLAGQFTICWTVFAGLIFLLSHDSYGRRIFLALCYGTYAIGYASFFDVIVYRPFAVVGDSASVASPPAGRIAVGLAVVGLMNFVFVRGILPRLPCDGRNYR